MSLRVFGANRRAAGEIERLDRGELGGRLQLVVLVASMKLEVRKLVGGSPEASVPLRPQLFGCSRLAPLAC